MNDNMRWDFENMTMEELVDDAKRSIDRYNAILIQIGAASMLNALEKDCLHESNED